jgi:hypothetical protein
MDGPDTSASQEHIGATGARELEGSKLASSSRKMSPALLNFWLDMALLVSVVFIVWITALIYAVFPTPTSAAGWHLWGFTFDQWHAVQFYAICACALLALEHVVLHWKWVCGVLTTKILRLVKRPDEGMQVIYGVAMFIGVTTLVVVSIIVGMLMVRQPGR